MSSVSQTSARRRTHPRTGRFLGAAAVAAILVLTLGPHWRPILKMAGQARPHAPDLALFATLSPALKAHLLAALAALALGAALMSMRKGRAFHRLAGWTWVALVATVAVSSLFVTSLNPGRWSLLHLLTGWTLIVLPLAVMWARRHDVRRHRGAMMGLFYGGFAINLIVAAMPGRTLWAMFMG